MKAEKAGDRYLRLDLQPKDGTDLKAYVVRRVAEETMKRGTDISQTGYVQELIKRDMAMQSMGDRVDQIMVKIMTLSGEDQDMVISLIDRLAR